MINNLKIAIDGGAATGKSTVAYLLAEKINFTYINTGSMYRVIALFALKNNLVFNENDLYEKLQNFKIFYKDAKILTNDPSLDLSELNSDETSNNSSIVASYPLVRKYATKLQKNLAKSFCNVVMEGRDIGTVIMPNADYKFFLTVKLDVAAKRRHSQLKNNISYDEIYENIMKRNEQDTIREVNPLMPAKEAEIIDTSNLTIEEVVKYILNILDKNEK